MVVVFNVFGVPDSTAQMHVSAFAGVEAFSNSSVFCCLELVCVIARASTFGWTDARAYVHDGGHC